MLLTNAQIEEILCFWFPNEEYNTFWFKQETNFDITIKIKYNNLMLFIYDKIKDFSIELYDEFNQNELVAIIILLDQFSRNINRINISVMSIDKPLPIREFTEEAAKLSKYIIEKKYYLTLPINLLVFALMPLRHLNNLTDYILLLKILDEIDYKKNILFNKFKNQTLKRYELLKV